MAMSFSIKKIYKSGDFLIFFSSIISFVLLIVVSYRPRLLSFFKNTIFEELLISDTTANVVSSILASIVAAFIFYCLIDLLPRRKRNEAILEVLNNLVFSIVEAYENGNAFSHEKPIVHANKKRYDIDSINHMIDNVKNLKEIERGFFNFRGFIKIFRAAEVADSRIHDFRNSLSLAVAHSPEKALQWLVLTDKVRLMSETYSDTTEEDPQTAAMKQWGKKSELMLPDSEGKRVDPANFSSFQLRALEYLEEARKWLGGGADESGSATKP